MRTSSVSFFAVLSIIAMIGALPIGSRSAVARGELKEVTGALDAFMEDNLDDV